MGVPEWVAGRAVATAGPTVPICLVAAGVGTREYSSRLLLKQTPWSSRVVEVVEVETTSALVVPAGARLVKSGWVRAAGSPERNWLEARAAPVAMAPRLPVVMA